jgi:hypothetical protein
MREFIIQLLEPQTLAMGSSEEVLMRFLFVEEMLRYELPITASRNEPFSVWWEGPKSDIHHCFGTKIVFGIFLSQSSHSTLANVKRSDDVDVVW